MKSPKAEKLKQAIESFNTDRTSYQRIWDTCLLFLQGRQHVEVEAKSGDVIRRKVRGSSVTVNLILNMYRNLQSRLEVAYPGTTVIPASPSAEDIIKAQSSEAALQYYWQASRMSKRYSELVGWLLSTGNAGFLTRYTGKNIITETVSPYMLYFEPGVTNPEESNWVGVAKIVNREDLAEAYPNHKKVIMQAAEMDEAMRQKRLPFMSSETRQLKDRLEIFDVYFRNGDRKILLDSTYLFETKWEGDVMPVQFVRYTKIPGRLFGMGAIEPLLELQVNYNKTRSQIIDNAELIGNPKWLIPKTAGVSANSITSRKGEKVYYNPAGGAPTPVSPPSLPGFVLQNAAQLASEMMDVSGIHATSLGKRAVGVTSGKAVEALSGRDMTQLQTTQNDIERATEDLGKTVLILMRKYYNEPRMMRMMDGLGKVVFNYLKATDLVDDPEVFIEAGSLFRNEKQDRDQRIMDLLEMGLIDKETALRELKFSTGNSFVTERMQSIAHANDILMAAAAGAQVEVFPTDDLKAFQDVFGQFMRNAEYYELPYERQAYIRDIYASIITFGMPDPQAAEENIRRTVFPRVGSSDKGEEQIEASYQSPVSAIQGEEEYRRMGTMQIAQQMVDEVPERGLRRTPMGGGG